MELEEILQNTKNKGIFEKEDWKDTVDSLLESTIHYKNMKIIESIYLTVMITICGMILFIDIQVNLFSKILISIVFIFSILSILFLIWSRFRFPILIKYIKNDGWKILQDYHDRLDNFSYNVAIPLTTRIIKDKINSGEIYLDDEISEHLKKEMNNIQKDVMKDYLKLAQYELKDLLYNVFNTPYIKEKYSKIKFIIDRLSIYYGSYLYITTIVLFFIVLFYKLLLLWKLI